MHKGLAAFNGHIDFVRSQGLQASAEHARKEKSFWRGNPAGGPWAWPISHDPPFAGSYVRQDVEQYVSIVQKSRDNLFSDTMPTGAPGEQLVDMSVPTFIMSGDDPAHAHSAAVALRELLPEVKLSELMPPQQNADTVGRWIRDSIAAA
jgi:hypothetical protein